MFNFSYVRCWICKWYQHVCVCISLTESGTLLSLLSATFLLSVSHWSKGQPPRAVCACAVQSSLTQGQDTRPLLYLTRILGSFQPPDPGSSATVLLVLAPWLCCWGSLASAWLWQQWTQLRKTICLLRSFLLISFFNTLVSIKFNSVVSLVRVLPGGNTVLQSEYWLLNLGKFDIFSCLPPTFTWTCTTDLLSCSSASFPYPDYFSVGLTWHCWILG